MALKCSWALALPLALVAVVRAADAAAEEPAPAPLLPAASPGPAPSTTPLPATSRALFERPHTFAEVEGGIIALPGAPIGGRVGGDTPIGTIGKGDATILTGVHVFWRGDPRFALGAGARFCPSPTADNEYGGASALDRTHARSYLWLGTEGRFYVLRNKRIDGYVGGVAGAVIISDRFTTKGGEQAPTNYGTRDVAIATEGFGLGAHAGVTYNLSERWTLGSAFRSNLWFLPKSRTCSAIGDCATITGRVVALELAFSVGYRIPL